MTVSGRHKPGRKGVAWNEAGTGDVAHLAVVAARIVVRRLILCHCLVARHDLRLRRLVLRMPAQRHGQARHGLHGQAERGKQQQEAGEAGIHGGKLTPHRAAMQAGAVRRRLPYSSSSCGRKLAASFCCTCGGTWAWRTNSMLNEPWPAVIDFRREA